MTKLNWPAISECSNLETDRLKIIWKSRLWRTASFLVWTTGLTCPKRRQWDKPFVRLLKIKSLRFVSCHLLRQRDAWFWRDSRRWWKERWRRDSSRSLIGTMLKSTMIRIRWGRCFRRLCSSRERTSKQSTSEWKTACWLLSTSRIHQGACSESSGQLRKRSSQISKNGQLMSMIRRIKLMRTTTENIMISEQIK